MKTARPTPSTPPTQPTGSSSWPRGLKLFVAALASVHLLIALSVMIDHISHPETVTSSDAWHMLYYHQFAEGGHCYYPRSDLRFVTDGYTPLTSEIFGWTIRLFGLDIRWIRLLVSVFGIGAMFYAGRCVLLLTGDRYFAWIAALLTAGLEMKWYLDVGPNTIHVFFAVLGLYLFLRDPALSRRTVILASLALFACFWSKQTGLAYMAAAVFYLATRDGKKALLGAGIMGGLSLLGIARYVSLPDSEFMYWVFEMNQHQPIIWSRLWDIVFAEILSRKYAILVALIAGGLFVSIRRFKDLLQVEHIFLGAAAVAGIYASCKYGSGTTQMWFFYMMMVIAGITALARFAAAGRIAPPVAGALLALQSLAFVEDVRPYYISEDDVSRYRYIMNILSTPDKSTYYINRGYLGLLAGQPAYPNAGEDCWENGVLRRELLSAERRAWINSDPWDIVIIDEPLEDGSFALYERLNQAYRPVSELPRARRFADTYDIRWRKIVFERGAPQPRPSRGPGGGNG
jgi:hypothetical protein